MKKRRIFLMLFLATAVLCSPGLLLSLRGLGVVDIREGTVLWQSVLAWEYAFEWIRVAGRRVMSSALMLTACVIAPPPPAYKFNVRHPPLLALHGSFMSSHSADRRGRDITATPEVLVGEASLKVCAIGTSNQSFYRRDDCDGCLCAAGSVWINYRDGRFFGKDDAGAQFCVSEKQWQQCYSSWPCCKYKPNFCWEFLWNGGRQTLGTDEEAPKVVVDSCSMHGGCHVMIRRFRQWVMISDRVAEATADAVEDARVVGVAQEDLQEVNKTLNLNPDIRGWGLPSSTQYLIKLGPHSAPAEWKQSHQLVSTAPEIKGNRYRTWQLVSRYQIVGQDHSGTSHEMVSWVQREWKAFRDDGAVP